MKRTALVFALVFLLTESLAVASISISEGKPGAFEVEWQRYLPGIGGRSVIQTQDGGFLILGTNASWRQVNDRGDREYINQEPILLKTDSAGNVLWQKTYQLQDDELDLSTIIKTTDGGYALGGLAIINTTEPGKMSSFTNRLCILKIDSNGNTQWSKLLPSYNDTYSDASTGTFGAIIQTNDGGYALAGGFSHTMYISEIWFVKTDTEGDMEFAKELDSPLGGPKSLAQKDHGYSIVGGIFGRGGSGGRAGIVRIDSQANTLGYDLYGETHTHENPYVTCGSPTSDGGFIIGGRLGGSRQSWIVRTDAEDVMVWDKTYTLGESYTAIDSISQTKDGGYIFAGTTVESQEVTQSTKYFTWIGKTDSLGIVESQIAFPGASKPNSISQTQDGGYVFVGTWRLNDIGNQQIWLVKFTSATIPSDQLPQSIKILSPETKLYPLGNISLTYMTDETISTVDYSLDGKPNATLSGNTTIIGLPEGAHNLELYAHDGLGNTETSEVNFTVGEPFPTTLIIEIVLLVVIVAILSFLLGFRMRRSKGNTGFPQPQSSL